LPVRCDPRTRGVPSYPGDEQWGLSGGYYADQCTADGLGEGNDQDDGLIKRLLPAAEHRYTEAGGTPEAFGPPEPAGHLYELDVQGIPETWPPRCLSPPAALLSEEQEVLPKLFGDSAAVQNLNIVAGDYVEQTDLFKDVVAVDPGGIDPMGREIERAGTASARAFPRKPPRVSYETTGPSTRP
jgi:hypothetical protein